MCLLILSIIQLGDYRQQSFTQSGAADDIIRYVDYVSL